MRFEEWEPVYREILADFGFRESEDAASARSLIELLNPSQTLPNVERTLAGAISGRSFLILGPCLQKEDVERDLQTILGRTSSNLVSVGEGTKNCLSSGIVPTMIFTDLDGFPASDVLANHKGAIAFIHAHGDNRLWLDEWVPRFIGKVVPTCQCKPLEGIYNWGGFTDGDRAYCTLQHFGAARIELLGFDFDEPCGNKKSDISNKKKKLAWARRIINSFER